MSRTKKSSWPERMKPRAGLQPREATTAWAMPYMHWAAAVMAWLTGSPLVESPGV